MEAGLLKSGGRQRTDATHVMAAVRTLSRLELAGDTLRAALEELAEADGDWLLPLIEPEWDKRYGRKLNHYADHLPTGQGHAAGQYRRSSARSSSPRVPRNTPGSSPRSDSDDVPLPAPLMACRSPGPTSAQPISSNGPTASKAALPF
ncbi:hypothetical protein SANTM175S_01427 [Streptomyces antimycoticus]